MWCQQCGHGGYFDHMSKWFENNVECPTGCGCKCNISLRNKQVVTSEESCRSNKNEQIEL